MTTPAQMRNQVEAVLGKRFPSAFAMRPPAPLEFVPSGIAEVDAALFGGLPMGAITELTGEHSCGRTTLVLSALAGITRQGWAGAYVDASDALDPVSAAALGVDLRRLLWVRAKPSHRGDLHAGTSAAADVGRDSIVPVPVAEIFRGGGHHPRHEAVGLDRAIGRLFQQHDLRTDFTPLCSQSTRRPQLQPVNYTPIPISVTAPLEPPVVSSITFALPETRRTRRYGNWMRLEQALRAADLLLNTGGFCAIVLDLADISPEQARSVPPATWYRFRLQAEKLRTLFLVMSREPCANCCATVSVHCGPACVEWRQAVSTSPCLLAGLRYRVNVEHRRTQGFTRKKPATSEPVFWSSRAT